MPFEWNALGSCRDTCLGFLVLLGALTIGGPVQAERADRQKPMNVEADAMRYDDLKRVNVFTGRVVVTKGSIVIRAARLEVRQDRLNRELLVEVVVEVSFERGHTSAASQAGEAEARS